MTVIRRFRRDNFAIVPNQIWEERTRTDAAGQTRALSFMAKGLLAYLLGRPHDWRVEVGQLRKVVGCGRDKAYALVNELIEFGYMAREQDRDDVTGRLGDYQLTVYDEPIEGAISGAATATKSPVPDFQEPVADRFLNSPLPANQEPDKERDITNNPPLPPSDLARRTDPPAPRQRRSPETEDTEHAEAVRVALCEVLDTDQAEAIIVDRAAIGLPLSLDEATAIARRCAKFPDDPNGEAARLMAASYRGCGGLRRVPKARAGRPVRAATSQALGRGEAAPSAGTGVTLVKAADPALFAAAVAASGKAWLTDARAGTFEPGHVERARKAIAALRGKAATPSGEVAS